MSNIKKKSWYKRLRHKYLFVILNEELEERFTFNLSRLNVFIVFGLLSLLFIVLTTILIAYTPLRNNIPGYPDIDIKKEVYLLSQHTDSLEMILFQREIYLENLQRILKGEEPIDYYQRQTDTTNIVVGEEPPKSSKEDSLLRAEFDNRKAYSLDWTESEKLLKAKKQNKKFYFRQPIKGIITRKYEPLSEHYGIDIVSEEKEAIVSISDGIVIFAERSVETGYVMCIRHNEDAISIYKHNSLMLKKQGERVKVGDPIAIIGESGELSTGPHLHFELWYKGKHVNPEDFISF